MKFLVLLLVLAVAVGWVMLRTRRHQAPPVKPPPPQTTTKTASPMLACAHCGLHLPGSEALVDPAGHAYCGAEHRDAGPR